MDHGAGDAIQPSCDSINGNDTASSDVVSLMGVEKDPAISKITKNIDNSVNDSSDNNVSVIVVDSGVVLPSGVSNVFYSIEDVAGIVGGDVSDSHVASDEAVVTSEFPSTPHPEDGAVLPGLSNGGSSGSGPSLKKGAGALSQMVLPGNSLHACHS